MIVKYKLLNEAEPEILSQVVNNHLNDGWELFGVCFLGWCGFCQAVILVDEDDDG